MYRSRSRIKLDENAFNFMTSIDDDKAILYYDIVGSEAHSIMLYGIGFLTLTDLKKILQGLEEVKKNPDVLPTNGYEDVHEALEAFIIKKAGNSSGGKMHTARSRNDQVVLDIHMKIREDINDICTAIIDLIDSLLEKANENKETIMPMYTHLQQAQIGTFCHFLLSYADALFRDMDRLLITYGRINRSSLGACAIGGTSINIDRNKTAALLGFDELVRNSIDATHSRDTLIEFATALSILIITLGRMAEDFIIWSTVEFGYLDISDEYSSTSSAMPQKKNPDAMELVRAKAATAIGNMITMFLIVKSLPSGYSRDLQDLKPALWRTSTVALQSIKMMNSVIKSVNVHKERMKEAADNSYAISLDIAEQLVVRKGIPFRSAHKVIGALVERAVNKKNIALKMLQKEDIEVALTKIESSLRPDEVLQIIREMTPKKALELRVSVGSPNPKQQQDMINFSYNRLAGYTGELSKRKKCIMAAFDNLSSIVEGYLNAT
ncbi:MAG: argininosuccinate lyase [Nitrososphaeraceae archaeon]